MNKYFFQKRRANISFGSPPIIDLDGSDSGQITLGTPPDIADWGGFSQGTAASRPHYNGNINGLTVPNFDGSDDFLSKSDSLGIGSFTFQFVIEKPTDALTRTIFAVARSSDDDESLFISLTGSGGLILRTDNTTTSKNVVADNTPTIITIIAPLGGGVTFYVDGVNQTLTAGTFNPTGTEDTLLIGARRVITPLAYWKGEDGVIRIWDRIISPTERVYYENALKAKWQ